MHGEEVARRPWQANRAGEEALHCSADRTAKEVSDPLAILATRLDAAAGCCRPATLDGRDPVRLRLVSGGFAVERRL